MQFPSKSLGTRIGFCARQEAEKHKENKLNEVI
jgi:hypothetical protein